MESFLQQQKGPPRSTRPPHMLVIGQLNRTAQPLSPWGEGGWIHDSFCNEGEREREGERRERVHVREETAKTAGKLYGGAVWWIRN